MGNFKVYRSSAGSGKTYTIVKEFLLLILDKEDEHFYRKILAITFTNKAAAELKERIVQHLLGLSGIVKEYEDLSMLNAISKELNLDTSAIRSRSSKVIESILYNYGNLSVSTIDKFVVRILRYFSKELNIHSDFAVELDTKQLMELTVDRVMEYIGLDEELTKAAFKFSKYKSDKDKSWKIKSDLVALAYFLKSSKSIDAVRLLKQVSEEDLRNYVKALEVKTKEIKEFIDDNCSAAASIINDSNPEVIKHVYKNIISYEKKVSSNSSGDKMYPTDAVLKSISKEHWHMSNAPKSSLQSVEAFRFELFPVYEKLIKSIGDLIEVEELLGTYIPLVFSRKILAVNEEIKKEQNLVLISDNNEMIADVIGENPNPFIYEKIGQNYKHFFIDEFQDTSILQWQNLIPLVEESLSYGQRNVIVGDSKQSIYRFRGGEMEQLSKLPVIHNAKDHHVYTESVFEKSIEATFLGNNYRSSKEIVSFNNDLYSSLLNILDEQYRSIYDKHDQVNIKGPGGMVALKLMECESDEDEDENMLSVVLECIENSLKKGYGYRDIAILVYKNNVGRMIAEHLKKLQIPIVSSESLLLNENAAVRFLVALISSLHSDPKDIDKLEIARFIHTRAKVKMTFADFLHSYVKSDEDFKGIYKIIDASFEPNTYLQLPLYSIVEELCKNFGVDSADAYVLEFLNICYKFSIDKSGSITDFLDFWNVKKNRVALKIADNISAIKILTVHSAKGLEFPVVINPYYFKKSRMISEDYVWSINTKEDMPVKLVPTKNIMLKTRFSNLVEEEMMKTVIDKLNVLYVATTRPTDLLFLLLPKPKESSLKKNPEKMENAVYRFCLKEIENGNENLVWGDGRNFSKRTEIEDKQRHEIKAYPKLSWRSQLRIAISDELKSSELAYGNILHNILAEIEHEDAIEEVLTKHARLNRIEKSIYEGIREKTHAIFRLEKIKHWHGKGLEIFSERELLSSDGKILRPDRVFVLEDKVVVVDFKTGAKNRRNEKQVEVYCQALRELKYLNVEGYLLYTEDVELDRVV